MPRAFDSNDSTGAPRAPGTPVRKNASQETAIIPNAAQQADPSFESLIERILTAGGNQLWRDHPDSVGKLLAVLREQKPKVLDTIKPFRHLSQDRLAANIQEAELRKTLRDFQNVCIQNDNGDPWYGPLRKVFEYNIVDIEEIPVFDDQWYESVDMQVLPTHGARVTRILQRLIKDTRSGATLQRGRVLLDLTGAIDNKLNEQVDVIKEISLREMDQRLGVDDRKIRELVQRTVDQAVDRTRAQFEPRIMELENQIRAFEQVNTQRRKFAELDLASSDKESQKKVFKFLIETKPSEKNSFSGTPGTYIEENSSSLLADFEKFKTIITESEHARPLLAWLNRRMTDMHNPPQDDASDDAWLKWWRQLRSCQENAQALPSADEVSNVLLEGKPAGFDALIAKITSVPAADTRVEEWRTRFIHFLSKRRLSKNQQSFELACACPQSQDRESWGEWWNNRLLKYVELSAQSAPSALPKLSLASGSWLNEVLLVRKAVLQWLPTEARLIDAKNKFIEWLGTQANDALVSEAKKPYRFGKWFDWEKAARSVVEPLAAWHSVEPDCMEDRDWACEALRQRFEKLNALRDASTDLPELYRVYEERVAADLAECLSTVSLEPEKLRQWHSAAMAVARYYNVSFIAVDALPQADANGRLSFDSARNAIRKLRGFDPISESGIIFSKLTDAVNALIDKLNAYSLEDPALGLIDKACGAVRGSVATLAGIPKYETLAKTALEQLTRWEADFRDTSLYPDNIYSRDCAVRLADLHDKLFETADPSNPEIDAGTARSYGEPLEKFLNLMAVFRDLELSIGRAFNRLSSNLKSVSRIRQKPAGFHPDQVKVSKIVRNRWFRRKSNGVEETVCEASYDVQ